MKVTVLGLAIIGVGSYVATLTGRAIWGFAIQGVGALIVAYAQRRDSIADSAKIQGKFDEFRRELASARQTAVSPDQAKRLDTIGQEFREWASDFVRNKDRRKLEATQVRASAVEEQLDKSDLWRPVIEFFLETVRQSIHAYAREAQVKASVQFPPLPSNLFDRKASYEGTVFFSENVKWKVRLQYSDPKLIEFPMLSVDLVVGSERHGLAHVMSLDRDDEFVNVTLHRDAVPRLPGIEGSFPFKGYQKGFGYSIRRLVEAQLLSL